MTTRVPPPRTLAALSTTNYGALSQVPSHTYEITFTGQADRTLRAQFDDCTVTTGPDTTTLRAEVPDQAALSGLVGRIAGLGLQIVHLHLVTPPARS